MTRWPALLAIALAAAPGLRAGDDPLPYRLELQVLEGTRRAPAELLLDVEGAILSDLTRERCVLEARRAPRDGAPSAPLLLRAILDDVREELRWDMALSERDQPQGPRDPTLESQVVLELRAQVELRCGAHGDPLRIHTFAARVARRPTGPGDDAAAGARSEVVERIVREARKIVCGSRRKLARAVEHRLAERTPAR